MNKKEIKIKKASQIIKQQNEDLINEINELPVDKKMGYDIDLQKKSTAI